ncbi:MAG: glycosyltransferase family 2 protein [Deltaproteobacteria bacterium]|nr:glycosyltransferase family 2 protein [Deltaproteobacteria bacterium]
MLEFFLWAGAILWIIFFINLTINLLIAPNLEEYTARLPEKPPKVSIVVPARNEERYIYQAVTSFCSQDYPDYEVIVVDDGSTDATPALLEELTRKFSHLKVIKGEEPPPGWLGKPNTLERGRKEAGGEWFLFVDADVIYDPQLLSKTMSHTLHEKADMMFLGPTFLTKGILEATLMSTLYFLATAAYPMYLTVISKSRRFAAGSGCFNLISRKALEASGAFESLKSEVIDDLGLGYKVKGAGFRQTSARSGKMIQIRMYEGARETIKGFTKNMYPMMKRHPVLFGLPVIGGILITFLPYYGFFSTLLTGNLSLPAAISLLLMHIVFFRQATVFHQPRIITFLNPVRELGWWWIFFRSMAVYYSQGIVWRGRRFEK